MATRQTTLNGEKVFEDLDKVKVIGSPEEIYLIYGDIYESVNHDDCDDVSWCLDQQFYTDVRYVRSDIAELKLHDIENRIKAIIATQKTLLTTRFNEGLQLGLGESKRAIADAYAAKENYLNENEKLTNMILDLESRIDKMKNEI